MQDAQAQFERAEAAKAQLRKLSAGGLGARREAEKDELKGLQAHVQVLEDKLRSAQQANRGLGMTSEEAMQVVMRLPEIACDWAKTAEPVLLRAALQRLQNEAKSVASAGRQQKQQAQVEAKAFRADVKASRAEAEALRAEVTWLQAENVTLEARVAALEGPEGQE